MKWKIQLDHIGIATNDLDSGSKFWNFLGLKQGTDDELVEDQGVITRFFSPDCGTTAPKIELLQATGIETPIGKFLDKRGPGVQQICFRVEDLKGIISFLRDNGIIMIDQEPRKGSGNKDIAFVHPKSTGGVLVELTQY